MKKISSYSKIFTTQVVALFLATGSFAAYADSMAYFNVSTKNCTKGTNCTYVITQSAKGCDEPSSGFGSGSFGGFFPGGSSNPTPCDYYKSVKTENLQQVNSALSSIIADLAEENPNGVMIELGSNIDLGGFSETTAEGECDAQFEPVTIPAHTNFLGGSDEGFKIRNLCIVRDMKDGVMSGPVGFFNTVDNSYVGNMNLKNVRMIVKDTRKTRDATKVGPDYYPVGSLAGVVNLSKVENVILEDVEINAPMAGGVIGFAQGSTICKIQADDDLVVTNDLEVAVSKNNIAGVNTLNKYGLSSFVMEYTVYLGGIVGLAVKDSLYDIGVKGQIIDLSGENTPSALGGLAGALAGGDNGYDIFNDTLKYTPAAEGSEATYTIISGGKAMGGFFGEVNSIAQSTYNAGSRYYLRDSRVDSVRILNSVSDSVFVGGFVGKSIMTHSGFFSFENAYANVDIQDNLTQNLGYNYFAGAFVGKTNECGEGNYSTSDEFNISIVSSNALGNISVSSDESKTTAANAYLGGFAGKACFSGKSDAFENNTSSVVIESALKTSGGKSYVGGIAGFADEFRSNDTLIFMNSSFDGKLIVWDKGDSIDVGGVVGSFQNARNAKVIFKEMSVKNENLITLKTKDLAVAGAKLRVGGVCGYCSWLSGISQVSVVGDIALDDDEYAGDSLIIGGLVGGIYSNFGVSIFNTYSVGTIDVPAAVREEGSVRLGYLMGSAVLQGTEKHEFVSNYHFSDADSSYLDAFGYLSNGGDITGTWKDQSGWSTQNKKAWTIQYNVRNGVELDVTETINGSMKNELMQNKSFAADMNKIQNPYVWSYEIGLNNDLPFFADNDHFAISPSGIETWTVVFEYFENGSLTTHIEKVPDGETAEAPKVPQYIGHTFVRWDKNFSAVTSDMKVKAVYDLNSYTISFMSNGEVLQEDDWDFGETPKFTSANPTKPASDAYTYKFSGWSPVIAPVSDDATYTAVFDSTLRSYTISFENAEVVLQSSSVKYGELPTYAGTDPTKAATAEYTYSFKGWSPEVVVVEGTATYKALFDSTKNTYKVTFVDGEKIVDEQNVEFGEMPAKPSDPTRDATLEYTYKFSKWTPDFEAVAGDATYKAVFDSTKNTYVVRFMNGSTELQSGNVAYGETPKYTKETPTKKSTAQYSYSFMGWDAKVVPVSGSATYHAVFDSVLNAYDVIFMNEDTELQRDKLTYGTVPHYNGKTPTKDASAENTYEFSGWNPIVDSVKAAVVYKAVFDSTVKSFRVTFIDNNGDVLDVLTVKYGSSAKAPEVPDVNGYEFVGWSRDFSKVTSDMIVLAKFEKIMSSSSSAPNSSSSSAPNSSSSYTPNSSSSEIPPSSSSYEPGETKLEIVEPKIEQSGNAIRVTFGANIVDTDIKTGARVEVVGDAGTFVDTVLTDSITKFDSRSEWEMFPAPVGEYEVVLTLYNAVDTISYSMSFEVSGKIVVQPRSWQMVSLAALDVSTNYDADDAAFYWWDEMNPVGDFWQYRSYAFNESADASRGYWYGTQNGNPLVLKEESPTKESKITWELDSLYSGWNLVANPHGWYVDLTTGEGGEVTFWRWNPVTGSYEIPTVLGPYEAVWAKVSKPMTWTISAKPVFQFAKSESPKSLAKSAWGEGWNLQVSLADEFGKQDSWNFLGVGSGESLEEPPSGMGDRVNLSIVENKKYLAKSVKPEGEDVEWTLEVSATSARDGFVSFDGVESLAKAGFRLFVTADERTVEVTGDESVKVALSQKSKQIQVHVLKGARAIVSSKLSEFRAFQTGTSMNVSFFAPANMAGAACRVEMVSIDGKIVASRNFDAIGGTNRIIMEVPKSGLYFVRTRVGRDVATVKVMAR